MSSACENIGQLIDSLGPIAERYVDLSQENLRLYDSEVNQFLGTIIRRPASNGFCFNFLGSLLQPHQYISLMTGEQGGKEFNKMVSNCFLASFFFYPFVSDNDWVLLVVEHGQRNVIRFFDPVLGKRSVSERLRIIFSAVEMFQIGCRLVNLSYPNYVIEDMSHMIQQHPDVIPHCGMYICIYCFSFLNSLDYNIVWDAQLIETFMKKVLTIARADVNVYIEPAYWTND